MENSLTLEIVQMRAKAEMNCMGANTLCVEHLFLGILKLSEMKAKDLFIAPEPLIKMADEDIADVQKLLKKNDIDSTRVRRLLRHEANHHQDGMNTDTASFLSKAAELSSKRSEKKVSAASLLLAIIEKPTMLIKRVTSLRSPEEISGKPVDSKGNAKEASQVNEMTPNFLPVLTNKLRDMRSQLLSTVQGQDHVVHAFTEGMFAAEVLAASDEKRKRPRAIFVFAGPPGVGKTFLAEQAAEALGLPDKHFDMSAYSDHQSYTGLVGFEPSYKDAKEGTLTGFVKENPHSILLFDEIEKAHLNTIQLFLQILDAGRLTDRFLDEEISFKDTIIIFTTNAGRSLYEGNAKHNAAGIPRKTILNALETEKDPRTGQPFFPAAITSRISTGWPLLFNHLQAHDLEKISSREFSRFCDLFEKQYGVKTKFDDLIPTALLFREGGQADARTMRAQTEIFFKAEVFKVCRLWGEDSFSNALSGLREISFTAETDQLSDDVQPLFRCDEKPEILLYGDSLLAERCRQEMTGYIIHSTDNVDEALKIAGEKDIRFVLLDPAQPDEKPLALMATVYEHDRNLVLSAGAFDYAPMAAGAIRDGNRLFRCLHERLPELPIYILETPRFAIDAELEMNYVLSGARCKLTAPSDDFSVFEDTLSGICSQLYMQSAAAHLASESKMLFFETAPKLSEDGSELTIRLRDFAVKRATAADNMNSVLDEVEKPNIRFNDVIGASDAKDELKFFIDYLKNPKKFSAQGLKPPKGVLLYGPPGTGKTMLAKAMAGESDVAFIPVTASAFVTKYQGSGPEAVRELFKKARRYAPAILFIDEIDAIGRKRGESNSGHGEEMALNALLTEMDGFSVDPKRPVFILAATNFDVEKEQGGMGVIDPALVRRFDRKILVDLPNAEDREKLLQLLLKQNASHTVSPAMLHHTAERAMGMSPANLTGVVELANRMAVKAGKPLDDAILDEAFELTKHGEKKNWGFEYMERVARHESGHAFLCFMGGNTPAYMTIVPRGDHGGYMEHSAKEMGPLSTKEELLNRIRTSLGGRAAEIAYYGEKDGVSTGASGDLEQATHMATAMITTYGMDESFGLAAMDQHTAQKDPAVKKRVNEILGEEMRYTIELIKKNKYRIDRLVDALMKKNKLTGEEMEELLKE